MHASVGMLSREICPQFGQVSSEVVISGVSEPARARRDPANAPNASPSNELEVVALSSASSAGRDLTLSLFGSAALSVSIATGISLWILDALRVFHTHLAYAGDCCERLFDMMGAIPASQASDSQCGGLGHFPASFTGVEG